MMLFIDRIISWVYVWKIWGSRCSEIEEDCICCQKWMEHDETFNEKEIDND